MQLNSMPLYCGGRFLIGLWSKSKQQGTGYYNKETCMQKCMDNPLRGFLGNDPWPYIPEDLLGFQQLLKWMTNNDNIGVIYAVTSPEQDMARDFLSQTGFKMIGEFKKHVGNKCQTWVGDFYKDVKPILDKVDFWEKKENKFREKEAPVTPANYFETYLLDRDLRAVRTSPQITETVDAAPASNPKQHINPAMSLNRKSKRSPRYDWF